MALAAGILAILFALTQGAPSILQLRRPMAARGSHDTGAIPPWARYLWVVLAFVSLIGAILYLLSATVAAASIIALGAVGIWILAIPNGFWIHGTPTLSHHVIRAAVVAVMLFLAFAGAE